MNKTQQIATTLAVSVLLLAASQASTQDWPQWRGPNRDGKVTGFTPPKTWPKELTKKWSVEVGQGESSPVLAGNKLYVFARPGGKKGPEEVTVCLDAATGKEIWTDKYQANPVVGSAGPHPGTRSTPAVAEGKICTLGASGDVSCLDATTGKMLWRKSTNAKPQFYTSSSPLVADGLCIVYVDVLTAFDLATGAVKWTWKGSGTPYGSPILMTVDGIKQVVTPSEGSLTGINLVDGKQLWQVAMGGKGDYQGTFSTPIIDGATVIYSSPGKKKGSTAAYKVEKKESGFVAAKTWEKALTAHKYNTPVLRDGKLFGLQGQGGSTSAKSTTLFCMDAKTGDTVWTENTPHGECGTVLDAAGVLVLLSSDGQLVFFEPSAKGYKQLAQYQVDTPPSATQGAWGCPILTGNRIYVKDTNAVTLWTVD